MKCFIIEGYKKLIFRREEMITDGLKVEIVY